MFKFTVKPDQGEPFECEATSRDIVRWEGMSRNNSIGALSDNLRMTDLTDLCWFTADRLNLTELDRLQFAAGVDIDFTAKDDEDESGPTQAGR